MLMLLPLMLTLASVGPPSEDSLTVKCSDSKRVPVGALSGQGLVRYQVAANGRPDTLTLRVVATNGISAAALRSAAARILPTCRLKAGHVKLPVAVSQGIRFENPGFTYSNAAVTADALLRSDTLSTAPPPSVPGGPYAFTNALLEERPQALGCELAKPINVPGNDLSTIATEQHMREGWARLRFVVAPNGRAIADSVTVVATSNPASTNRAVQTIVDCKFAPGRVAGVPVATIMFQELNMD